MKIKEGYYQHKCSVCGDLYTAKGKISVECQECTIKRLEETINRQDEEILSNKYRVARLLHISDENDKLKQQLQEQEHYVELGKMWDWYYTESKSFYAIAGGRLSKKRKYEMLKERVLADYRNEVNNEA